MPFLGDLEHAVMDVLWARSAPTSVREVHEELVGGRDIAYTTVMTVLDRLAKKDIVQRKLDGRAWLYLPAKSRIDLYVDTVDALLVGTSDEDRRQIWTRLAERLGVASHAG